MNFVSLNGNGEPRLRKPGKSRRSAGLNRREFLLRMGQGAPLAFLPAGLRLPDFATFGLRSDEIAAGEFHLHPQYRTKRELDDVLQKVRPGLDGFVSEAYHEQIAAILKEWREQLLQSPQLANAIDKRMGANFSGMSAKATVAKTVRDDAMLQVWWMTFGGEQNLDRRAFLGEWRNSLLSLSKLLVAEFQVTRIRTPSPR